MFIGHFGLALGAKQLRHQPSLASYFFAAQFLDLLWPLLLLAGIEKVEIAPGNTAFTPLNFVSYPYSHSLAMVIVWSVLFGFIYWLIKKDAKGALIMCLLVSSHWFLDLITHRPDLPISPWNDTKAGLGLWNHRLSTIIVEVLIFALGCYLYGMATRPVNKTGRYAFAAFVLFMIAIYFLNVFGPPPESAKAIAVVGLTQWVLIAWGYWIDRNRVAAAGHLAI